MRFLKFFENTHTCRICHFGAKWEKLKKWIILPPTLVRFLKIFENTHTCRICHFGATWEKLNFLEFKFYRGRLTEGEIDLVCAFLLIQKIRQALFPLLSFSSDWLAPDWQAVPFFGCHFQRTLAWSIARWQRVAENEQAMVSQGKDALGLANTVFEIVPPNTVPQKAAICSAGSQHFSQKSNVKYRYWHQSIRYFSFRPWYRACKGRKAPCDLSQ